MGNTLCFSDLLVVANNTHASASVPFVIQALEPLRTHWLPASFAIVDAAPASLPLPVTEKYCKTVLRITIVSLPDKHPVLMNIMI